MISFSMTACGGDDDNSDKEDNDSATPATPQPFNDITAAQLVAKIKIGWNLGNTLDTNDLTWLPANPTVAQMETAWSNPVTTKANITALKNAGFNAIRIPVSWDKAVDSNYNIREDWMKRVTEVVNYAVDNDMYILLNTHHDEHTFKFTNAEIDKSLAAFKKIWEQIADNFKNYNEKLIFEGLNEPRTIGSDYEWTGGTAEEHTNLNKYYPIFVDVVRKSGGNNNKRILMINTYAAWINETAVNGLTLPTNDTVSNKLVVSIHAYQPFDFAYNQNPKSTWSKTDTSDTNAIHDAIQPAYDKFVSKGIPVIIGEFGSVNKNNIAARTEWAEYYVSYARSKGIPCFYWDNGVSNPNQYEGAEAFAIFNRNNNTWHFQQIVTALMNGVNNTDLPTGGGASTITGNLGNFHTEYGITNTANIKGWNLTPEQLTGISNGSLTKLELNIDLSKIGDGLGNVYVILNSAGTEEHKTDQFPWTDWINKTDISNPLVFDLTTHSGFSSFKSNLADWGQILLAYYGNDDKTVNDLHLTSADLK